MADTNTVVHIGENSPEQVALKLVNQLALMEGKDLYAGGKNTPDKKWLLDNYAECLHAVRGFRKLV